MGFRRHKTRLIVPPRSGVDCCLPIPVAAARALNAEASYFASGQDVSRLTRYLFHDPCALGAFTLPNLLSIASVSGAMKVQTSNLEVIQMNNRNQTQTTRATAPAEATAPTYLNVFTVEEYERDGKTQKRWTKIGAAFPHKEGIGFSIELKAFPIDGRLVALPPDTDDGTSRNGK
jgi:hypothetical protein